MAHRRINHGYTDDDLYNDDDYYDDDYYEEEEAAALAAQYAPRSQERLGMAQATDMHAAEAISQAPPREPVGFTIKGKKGKSKKGKCKQGGSKQGPKEEGSRDAQGQDSVAAAQTASLVFQISEIVPGISNHDIRQALASNGNDVERATAQLLNAVSGKNSQSASLSAQLGNVVFSLGGEGSKGSNSSDATKSDLGASLSADNICCASGASNSTKMSEKKTATSNTAKRRGREEAEKLIVDINKLNLNADLQEENQENQSKPNINLVVVGHVDAGKSTLFGHLLYQLKYISAREMHKFEKESRNLGKASFAFAWVMDTEEDERERGVTVDVGIKYFETEHRMVTLLDAPGHRDFIPNMISGAAQADVAVLVVPANPGEFESSFADNGQTKEHAVLVRYSGIRRLVIAVNKMDMCDWSRERFHEVTGQLREFLSQQGYQSSDLIFVPVSGLGGINLTKPIDTGALPQASWYEGGPSLVGAIDSLPPTKRPVGKPLRLVVADLFKTMLLGPLTVSGKIEAGAVREGQFVVVSPGNHRAKVKAIQRHHGTQVSLVKAAKAGETVDVGLTDLEEQMIGASSILCDPSYPMPVVSRFTAEIATLAGLSIPLLNGTQFDLHIQSVRVPAKVARLISVEQSGDKPPKANPRFIRKNQTATVEIATRDPISVEKYEDFRPLSRVLLRQNGVTVAAGRVTNY